MLITAGLGSCPHPCRLWSLWEMIELHIRPFLAMQDVLVQWSVHLRSAGGHFAKQVPERNRVAMRKQRHDELLPELAAAEFDMCRRGAERLLDTLSRESRPAEISADIDDLRRRLIDQAESIYGLQLSAHEAEMYKQ